MSKKRPFIDEMDGEGSSSLSISGISSIKKMKEKQLSSHIEVEIEQTCYGNLKKSSDLAALADGVYFNKIERLGSIPNVCSLSLAELIRRIRPIASIHFNYCIDPRWVLSQYSHGLRKCPISFVVGQQQLSSLKDALATCPNVQAVGVPMLFPYGTHHSKLSLFEAENALHVVISTANLVPEDWSLKTQAFYHARAKFCSDDDDTAGQSSSNHGFREDLLDYLREAYPSEAGKVHHLVTYWTDRLGHADFSHIKDRIVGSVPGRRTTSAIARFGHMRLRHLLATKFSTNELLGHKTFVGQFSSIGSLGATPESWLCDEFLTSLSGAKSMLNPSALKLIYPSVQNVRNSMEGYVAGFSLPYSSTTHKKQRYLQRFLYQWKSERLGRSSASPHVKSYAALDEYGKPHWLLLTSANLSISAWGKLEKSRTQLFIRSFELGVLICAKDHQGDDLPVPFDLPLTKYGKDDGPFLVDEIYPDKPDQHGFHGVAEAQIALG